MLILFISKCLFLLRCIDNFSHLKISLQKGGGGAGGGGGEECSEIISFREF